MDSEMKCECDLCVYASVLLTRVHTRLGTYRYVLIYPGGVIVATLEGKGHCITPFGLYYESCQCRPRPGTRPGGPRWGYPSCYCVRGHGD